MGSERACVGVGSALGGEAMDQQWVSNGSAMDQQWISNGSTMDEQWLGHGLAIN